MAKRSEEFGHYRMHIILSHILHRPPTTNTHTHNRSEKTNKNNNKQFLRFRYVSGFIRIIANLRQ